MSPSTKTKKAFAAYRLIPRGRRPNSVGRAAERWTERGYHEDPGAPFKDFPTDPGEREAAADYFFENEIDEIFGVHECVLQEL